MSRGLGPLQRRICQVLHDADNQELPLRELRRRLGEPGRSNLRRATRGLLEREVVRESSVGGKPGLALTVWGYIGTSLRSGSSGDLSTPVIAGRGERVRPVKKRSGAVSRRPGAGPASGLGWVRHEHRFVRRRPLGETQRLVLRALIESSGPKESDMSVTVVKKIVGADRSNTRRAIRTLLLRGLIEESEDGRRIRLTPSGTFAHFLHS
jgi:hypothetical protein